MDDPSYQDDRVARHKVFDILSMGDEERKLRDLYEQAKQDRDDFAAKALHSRIKRLQDERDGLSGCDQ